MTYEEQLDEAFKFLMKWEHGSFKYYKYDGKNIGENFPEFKITDERDKLQWHLINRGIDEMYTMPIIYHLISDGHLEPNWQPDNPKENGNPPSQIKITWKGVMFWNNGKGGYVNEKNIIEEKEILSKEQTNSVINTNENQIKFSKRSIYLGAFSTLFIGITIVLSICDKTPQRLRDIENAVRSQDTTLQNIRFSLEENNSSNQKVTNDTILVNRKN